MYMEDVYPMPGDRTRQGHRDCWRPIERDRMLAKVHLQALEAAEEERIVGGSVSAVSGCEMCDKRLGVRYVEFPGHLHSFRSH